ncbi:SWIM zinc finger family protein [Streptomyces sp. NBC_00237]|uniref:SWIM zinc finger family protein n=1 Tax=Streptomyces sp. NBC_00237 TaxID=2975687 RepID=UPI00224F5C51|nr:SWIM zinc finger family protein [Streptomyces sp. NBC_00237]MCX5205315.1 SWIM zinc finger family protein [Streptomyces sp. NBC_00237]
MSHAHDDHAAPDDHAAQGTAARGFAAFAARRGGRTRAQSWWGQSWTEAVEDTSLSTEALKSGRAYARSGRLGPITVSPGRIAAQAYEDDTAFDTVVTFTELDEGEWERLWERTAERPAVLNELLAGELPPDLLEASEDARVRILPGYGDLEAECDCDEFEDPCSHAAALCYQVSWLLDAEPSLLLLIRGRGTHEAREELKSVVLMQAMTGAAEEEGEGDGVPEPLPDGTPAQDAYDRAPASLPPLPPLPGPSARRSGPLSGVGADPLSPLVAGAAARARELLAHVHGFRPEPPAPLDTWQDTVRIAATHPDPRAVARLREACGAPERLDRAARAWQLGGSGGLDVLEESWTPPHQDLARARTTLAADWAEDELPAMELADNHVTLTGRGLQLRYGRDGRWYPYRQQGTEWWPSAPPQTDPAAALADLLNA